MEGEMSTNPKRRGPVAGIADIQALAVSAITQMEQANLKAEVQLVHERVLSRPPEQLLEPVAVDSQTVWTFTPIVELLMLELQHLAKAPGFSAEERRERIRWTLDIAGF
jgi:hypothetical protein